MTQCECPGCRICIVMLDCRCFISLYIYIQYRCIEGVLIGTVRVISSSEISDTEEDKLTLSTCIGITEFLSYRGRAPLRHHQQQQPEEVGVFSVRRDVLEQPSFRDVVAARKIAAKQGRSRAVVIVVINVPERGPDPSWIVSMHYSCFALSKSGSPYKIDLEVLSLAPENPFNFKSLLLHSSVRESQSGYIQSL